MSRRSDVVEPVCKTCGRDAITERLVGVDENGKAVVDFVCTDHADTADLLLGRDPRRMVIRHRWWFWRRRPA